jgi:hypothetical protein
MSRPTATLAEVRATRRAVTALAAQVERLILAVEALRAGQPSQLVTVARLVELGYGSPATLRRRIKDGSIPCIRHGRTIRIDLATLVPKRGRVVE